MHPTTRRTALSITRIVLAMSLSGMLLLAASGARSEEPDSSIWPPITQSAKPWTRWWWPGSAVDEANLSKQLSTFAEAGLGGVEITPIYGARGAEKRYIEFLSDPWMRMLEHSSAEAQRLGLGIDMATGTGWPFGGPRVEISEASHKIILDNGRLNGEPTQMKVKRAAPGGEGWVLDPYSTASLDAYLLPFSSAFAQFPKVQVRGQFHDSFEYYDASWSPRLTETFQRMHGYDIQTYAAQLMHERPIETDTLARIKADYRETLARMHLEYLSRWVRWSRDHGFLARNQSHGAPANLLDLYGAVDIPETESFGSTVFSIPGLRRDPKDVRTDHSPPHPLMYRMASSAAHVMGRQLASSETGTWLREHWKESPASMKPQIDQLFTGGINHIFYHGTVYTPADASWPGWYFYASTQLSVTNPLWQDFAGLNTYVARVQSILQSGNPDNEVLLYWPFADVLHDAHGLMLHFGVEKAQWLLDSPAGKLASRLQAQGYGFDFISDDQLLSTRFESGRLKTPGNHYRALVVPATQRMPLATLTQLSKLVDEGAVVLFESLPEDVPGYGRLEERRAKFRSLLKVPRIAQAVVGTGVEHALAKRDIVREPLVAEGLSYVRRIRPSGHDYFFVNLTSKRFDGWVELGVDARSALLLDPLTGTAGIAALKASSEGRANVYLQLSSGESALLKTYGEGSEVPALESWSYLQPLGSKPEPLSGEWTVHFIAGGPTRPASVTTSTLKSWTDFGGEEPQRFAGTARYRIEFDRPKTAADEWLLDLGDVREAARVRLNGKDIGAAWSLPFQVRVDSLKPRANILEIEVTNLAANRIRDLDRRQVPWRVMNEIDIVNIHYRRFDASSWDLAPSGLLGPVTLIPMKRLRANDLVSTQGLH